MDRIRAATNLTAQHLGDPVCQGFIATSLVFVHVSITALSVVPGHVEPAARFPQAHGVAQSSFITTTKILDKVVI